VPPSLLAPALPEMEQVDERLRQQEHIPMRRVWHVVATMERPRAPAWVIGSLAHEVLAAWRFPGDDLAAGVAHRFERWAQARARGHGITDPRQLADALRRSRQSWSDFGLTRSTRRWQMLIQDSRGTRGLEVIRHVESGILDALYQVWQRQSDC
jgi:hypothetical protein